MLPHLEWRVPDHAVSWDVLAGRSTPQGLRTLRARVRAEAPSAVVVSLGSNDGPHPGFFAHRVRRVLAAVPARTCVVWPTIARPRRKGDATGLNRVLRRIALEDARLVVVDWEREVAGGRVVLRDGLHPDVTGFALRSRLIAAALRDGCAQDRGGAEALT